LKLRLGGRKMKKSKKLKLHPELFLAIRKQVAKEILEQNKLTQKNELKKIMEGK
jgi:hypothetical protein